MFKIAFFVFAFVLLGVNAQDGSTCRTPSQLEGVCISIKFCNEYLEILSKYGASPSVSDLLRQVHCGWKGNDPMVCCPQLRSKPVTPAKVETTTSALTERTFIQPNQYYSLPRPPLCGYNIIGKNRVVNGVPALLGEFPWIVALGYRNSKNPNQPKWLCGGSMITDTHIITAGHCVHNRPDLYLARIGELDLYSDDDGAQPSTVTLLKVKVHEHYNPTSYTNDIAIITLAQPHNNPTVHPVCLPVDEPLRSNDFVGGFPFVAGWGAIYFNGPSSSNLQTAIIPVVKNEECSRAFINFRTTTIDQRVLCAGYFDGGKDACQGDSGGPLMISKLKNKTITFYQIGVVSYGFRCAEQGFPGVYTRLNYKNG
ncbi:hypothetical protein RN001_015966 [Aquatica leii]|uniref:CLIP domain-containing serine protease n=1 Tax=Aquatica leii TaxID=1421715 RepID=A0AAN7NWZ2_9COLE|nr:hypothetical protein RN001_015966 [Aquatica leii]